MTNQPEPESGAARDVYGVLWVFAPDRLVWTGSPDGDSVRRQWWMWQELAAIRGPMTPLLPAEDVPEGAAPFVGYTLHLPAAPHPGIEVYGPTGPALARLGFVDEELADANEWGLPIPPKPEPSLSERARDRANFLTDLPRLDVATAGLLIELADELENRQ